MAEAIGIVASVITVIDLSAKVASRCSEYHTNVKNARDDIERLQKEAKGLKATLERIQLLCVGPNGAKFQDSQSLLEGVKDCKKQLAQLVMKLEPRITNKLMSQYGMRALRWPLKRNEVDAIMRKLEKCKDSISFSLQVDQEVRILSIHQEIVLNRLRSADNAAFDSHDEEHNARCHQGTRVELLRQIDTWARDPSSECVFWLNGMAGTGKSTISRTVAQNLADKGDLGASFFFKRGEGERGHAGSFIATIATQLVQKLPSLAPHVQNAIEADPVISKKALSQQFETLILQPLHKLQTHLLKSSRIVIVIDALDECDREEDVRIIIRLLPLVERIASIQIKFFLTSRPELSTRLGFQDISGKYERLALHYIPVPVVKEDISVFLEHELAIIRDDYNKSVSWNRQLPTDWPGQTNIQSLVAMAIPLFIFAKTICRFINDRKCGQPKDQLTKILNYNTRSQASKLDATYLPVLDQLLVGVNMSERRILVAGFQQVVGSIIILVSPLSATALDGLLGVPEGTVDSRIDLLHSVLSIPSYPDHPVRLFHLSFRDFLLDTEKRETNLFWVDEKDAHNKLATRCLELLSAGNNLKKDICNLQTPERPRASVDKQTINSHLSPEIQYACQYWVFHLKEGRDSICDNGKAHTFLTCHFLHWLEALSFIGSLHNSIAMVDDLVAITEFTKSMQLSRLLHDAKRFILSYFSIADTSPLQLYSCALIFAPKASIIRNTFQNCRPDWISQQVNTDLEWTPMLQTLEGHSEPVKSVAFSHDSKLLASVSYSEIKVWDTVTGTLQLTLEESDMINSVAFLHNSNLLASASGETVRVWDAATGTLQQILKVDSDRSIAFSHDSKLLASTSNKSVKVWDAITGTMQQRLEGHSDSVNAVAFSHNSKLLASASTDKTVKIWDTATGKLHQTLEGRSSFDESIHDLTIIDDTTETQEHVAVGHEKYATPVAFSHDSKLLASTSNKSVKVWDAITGTLQQILVGHSNSVNSVAISYNSKLLASASGDKTIKVWDMSTGTLHQTLRGHIDSVDSVAFSHHAKLLASGSFDRTVKLWDPAISILEQTNKHHSSPVSLVAFSQNSKLLASASEDLTVKIWDTATGTLQQTIEGYSNIVTSVAFSDDSKLLALASYDKIVKVWNTSTGTLQQTFEGHSFEVRSVVFSHDSKLLASGSADETVKVWDAVTGTLQQTLKGHSDLVSLVAFSHNSKLLASASYDWTIKIWNVATSTLQKTIHVNEKVYTLSFDITSSNLITNIGSFEVDGSRVASLAVSSPEVDGRSDYEGLYIKESWITWNGQNLLWLPPDFRGYYTDISLTGSKLAIGCQSGRVVVIAFSLDILRSCCQ